MTRIHFNEVVTRDGFQNEAAFVATDHKVALIDALSGCGFAKIEVTSFTSPKAIPMLRDAEEVMGRIRRVPGVELTVLVPNRRGAERALESRADELNLVMSVSETHNRANLRMSRQASFEALREVIALEAVVGEVVVLDGVRILLLEVLVERPAEGDVEHLQPTAQPKHRLAILDRPLRQLHLRTEDVIDDQPPEHHDDDVQRSRRNPPRGRRQDARWCA